MSNLLEDKYKKLVEPKLRKVARMARRGKSRQEIANELMITGRALNLMSLEYPELHDALMVSFREHADRASKSLIKLAEGFVAHDNETTYDGDGSILSRKLKMRQIPPNLQAIEKLMQMSQDFYGVDERLVEARIRSMEAEAKIKEHTLKALEGGEGHIPLLGILEGVRTVAIRNGDE